MLSWCLLTTAALLQTVRAQIHINQNGVKIKFVINFENICKSDAGKFAYLLDLSVEQCVQECGLRKHCVALNFKRRANACELLSSEGDDILENTGCIHIRTSDIEIIQKPCQECVYGEVCDTVTKQCRYKECLAALQNVTLLGNTYNIGNMVRYKCKDGYVDWSGVRHAKCLPSGQWSAFPDCELDCYTGRSWEYAGKQNVTKTGFPCQRWDAQTPRSHYFTNSIRYPDTTLAEAGNYCRNPDKTSSGPWCYSADITRHRWETCGISAC